MVSRQQPAPTWLDLYDYRRRVADMYRERETAFHAGENDLVVLRRFRAQKDALFAHHPQSALGPEARRNFTGLKYFPYDPTLRLEALLEPTPESDAMAGRANLPASGPHAMNFRRAARLRFVMDGVPLELV